MMEKTCGITVFLYGLVTVAIPLLIGDWGANAPRFLEDCLLVLGLCLILLPLFLALVLGFQRIEAVLQKVNGFWERRRAQGNKSAGCGNGRASHETEDFDRRG